jgi:GNAT superfamily N-acetyltransferase
MTTERGQLAIRPGRLTDSGRLREILARAKGHWGYHAELLRRWVDGYDFELLFRTHEVFVAEVAGEIAAWASLVPPVERIAVLDDLWVEPAWMGNGIGSRLFVTARTRAAKLRAAQLEWEAEPNALGFYERMGGRCVREGTSEWGRRLQIMAVPV